MRILLIAQEPPLDPAGVVTGNAVRCRQLTLSLEAAGHNVIHAHRSQPGERTRNAFSGRDALRSLVIEHHPDLLLASWWELVEWLPFDLDIPLVLDFIAPRPLEQLFESPDSVRHDLRLLNLALRKCDLLLVGNELQKHLLILPMLEAGFDLRAGPRVEVVPLAGRPVGEPVSDPVQTGWTLVSGGISWPWRRGTQWWREIMRYHRDHPELNARLKLFGGQYPLHEHFEDSELDFEVEPLLPYGQFSDFLRNSAHIGLELADYNIERAYSQSFRSLEFLRHGLPLICNRYLPLAKLVARHDAGWLVDKPGDLPGLLAEIYADPAGWRARCANALELTRNSLDPDAAAAPLLEWLEHPTKATRLPDAVATVAPELGVPPLPQRLRKQAKLGLRAIRARLFGGREREGIVIVTRSDLVPTDHGAAVKIVETARGLASHGRRVAIVTDERHRWWEIVNGRLEARKVPVWVRLLGAPPMLAKLLHFSKDIPESNAFLYLPLSDGSFTRRTLYAARKIGAGILQAEFPAYAKPCLGARNVLGTPVVIVEHNVEYRRLREQLPELTDAQFERFKAIELDLCNRANAVICVSDNDREILARDGVEPARLNTIPHGVDLAAYDVPARDGVREMFGIPAESTLLVYHGTFSYAPNTEALGVFAHELLPRLESRGLDCHVLAIGRNPPTTSPHARIHFTGSVEHVAEWLKAADMAVIPLLEGGGTRMKIIDCFAAKLPLISSSKGIEGIPVENGRDALVLDDWDEMAGAILALARDPVAAEDLAENGYVLARKLDWRVIARRYLDLFTRI